MKITELLHEAAKRETAKPEDELDTDDSDVGDDSDSAPPGIDALRGVASHLGADLYTVTALDYESGFDIGRGDSTMISTLNRIAKDLKTLAPAVKFMRSADGADGSLAQIFVDGRSGYVFTMTVSEIGVVVDPDDWASHLDVDQATIVNKIVRIAERYSRTLAALDDERSYRRAESERENVLWALNYDEQSWPQSKNKDDAALADLLNYETPAMKAFKQKAQERYRAKKDAEAAAIKKKPAGRDKR